ncbi:MAG: hypothetical protein KAR07_06755 [Spirochaetes bacterium]|nr:hypothetical protein [Spirochaetota bacterium]
MRLLRIILGSILSLILYYGWIIILTVVEFTFFSEKEVIFGTEVVKSTISNNPIFNWLMAGLFLVFFFASQYILCNNSTEHKEKINYLRDMKITLMGFSLWLVVIMGLLLFQINIDYYVNIGGGYLAILIIHSKFYIPSPR